MPTPNNNLFLLLGFIANIQPGGQSLPSSPLPGVSLVSISMELVNSLVICCYLDSHYRLLQFEPEKMSSQIVARILVKVCLFVSVLAVTVVLKLTARNWLDCECRHGFKCLLIDFIFFSFYL